MKDRPNATTAQARWLDQQWKEFMPFVCVCPIRDTRAATVLLLVSAKRPVGILAKRR